MYAAYLSEKRKHAGMALEDCLLEGRTTLIFHLRRWVRGLNHFTANEATVERRSPGSNPGRRV